MNRRWSIVFAVATVLCISPPGGAQELSRDRVSGALRKAAGFFRQKVAVEGGYVWRYSADLDRREGEGRAGESIAWVQPPGTPSVGETFLDAYETTGDSFYLDAAREAAHALVRGQLKSGGWDYRIEFEPQGRARFEYRVPPAAEDGRNTTTLDDDTTQAALRMLMRFDRITEFADAAVHEAALFALDNLLAAQYPNGAWPQRFSRPPDPKQFPVKKAAYPGSWSRTHPNVDYAGYYTFNDNTIADMVATMFAAYATYGDQRYRAAAEKAGDFIILAQMPDPQPAWAQQYNANMHPAWARKFEPPAVTGGESQGVMRILLRLYRETADPRYLEPIPRAIAYLRASQLPNGKLARFYELETNTPLYFTRDYKLTYSSDDMPTHYGFITSSGLDKIEAEFEALKAMDPAELKRSLKKSPAGPVTEFLRKEVRAAIDRMDERGAWVEDDRLRYHGDDDPTTRIIDCRTFIKNVRLLCAYLNAE